LILPASGGTLPALAPGLTLDRAIPSIGANYLIVSPAVTSPEGPSIRTAEGVEEVVNTRCRHSDLLAADKTLNLDRFALAQVDSGRIYI
jgi:hypothetical protein